MIRVPVLLMSALLLWGCGEQDRYTIESPDSSIELSLFLTEQGEPRYAISKDGVQIIEPSRLGVTLDNADFTQGLRLQNISGVGVVHDEYEMQTGKQREISYVANQQRFSLVNEQQQDVDMVFRVSDDGVAFRYEFSDENTDNRSVQSEATSFAFAADAEAWLQPIAVAKTGFANTNPSYEQHYQMQIPVGVESPSPAGWVFPALFRSHGVWVLISEVGIEPDYHASRLAAKSPAGEYFIRGPMDAEVFPGGALMANSAQAFESPWRIIALGSLATLVESTLGTDLAAPAVAHMPFVKPGIASWSWALLKDEATVFDVQKKFIDYAADMDWEYTLIDAHWDTQIGYDRVKALVDYGREKNVGIWLWYNSAGSWNEAPQTPKNALLTHAVRVKEFRRLHAMGIEGLKVDFFGGDGQSMMQYYIDIAKDAADHELMLNYHGSTLPRGMQRTYPNIMTMEAVHGFEMITFFQDTADKEASHAAMLPFARNVFDPMDFTPTTFRDIPNIKRKTSNGFQLALPVLFLSGVQHIAETPEGMATVPTYVRAYMQQLPVSWDETRFVQGFPGKLAVIARRAGERWYVSGINGENTAKQLVLDLSFIEADNDEANGYVINDGAEDFSFSKAKVTPGRAVNVTVQGNGGFAMVFN